MLRIDAKQLQGMRDSQDVTIIDTLPPGQFEQTRIEGAINIPEQQDDFASQVESQVGDKHKPVVVYCASAECNSSLYAAEKLDAAGFEQVYEFTDGAQGWKKHLAQQQGS